MSFFDRFVPIEPGRVTFVAKQRYGLCGNLRAVLEHFRKNSKTQIALFYEGELQKNQRRVLEKGSVAILDRFNSSSMRFLLSSQLIIVDHSIRDCYITKRKPGRKVVNLWHGVPIKRIELDMPNLTRSRRRVIEQCSEVYDLMTASNATDRKVIARAFGLPEDKVLDLGLPRYDFLSDDYELPEDIALQERDLLSIKGDKKLVLYAPTFREKNKSPLHQNMKAITQLAQELEPLGWMLGVRLHPYDRHRLNGEYSCGNIRFLSADEFPETNIVLKHTDILITDFSSIWVDFLLLDRPIIGFATDFDHYKSKERDFLYNFEEVFPSIFCKSPSCLFSVFAKLLLPVPASSSLRYVSQKQFFLPSYRTSITKQICEILPTHFAVS